MDCTETLSRLHAYLDQELDRPSTAAIDQHLSSCPTCKASFAALAALRVGIRRHADYRHGAPAELAERIRTRLGIAHAPATISRPRWQWPQWGRWLPMGAVAAAAALISWTAAIQYAGLSAGDPLAEQVVAGHARSIVTSHLIEVASSDQHTVKPWLSSKLDFSPPVPDLAAAGFALAGGRLDYLDNRAVAALVYRYRQHVINLFVWPEEQSGDARPQALAKHGYNVLRWRSGGMNFWAISDVNAAELQTFAEAYASAR
ncbi:MAG TPA: anti-sigma factor [Burkholderiales bacterium]|nr:anti-sigma factor [Burkholderiales bacterium]